MCRENSKKNGRFPFHKENLPLQVVEAAGVEPASLAAFRWASTRLAPCLDHILRAGQVAHGAVPSRLTRCQTRPLKTQRAVKVVGGSYASSALRMNKNHQGRTLLKENQVPTTLGHRYGLRYGHGLLGQEGLDVGNAVSNVLCIVCN